VQLGNLFQLFNLVKNSTKEESVQSPYRFKRQLPFSISPYQRSPANCKVFRIGLHATASKSSPRKALFSLARCFLLLIMSELANHIVHSILLTRSNWIPGEVYWSSPRTGSKLIQSLDWIKLKYTRKNWENTKNTSHVNRIMHVNLTFLLI
jgi:hypothetical protein